MTLPWVTDGDALIVTLRLTPKGGKDALVGIVKDADDRPMIKAQVSAPPVDGAANTALIKLLSKSLGIPKSAIRFHSGETARVKRLRLTGDVPQIIEKLSEILKV
ncbi:MAG TPA: DUF167 family protein [Paracoccaceae bacterium]|nr:DUF167 family protein [Paracoccaceae bacterium]